MNRELCAVLWDLDGTLIDSEPYWMRSETDLAAAHGAEWTTEDALGCIGHPLAVTAGRMADRGVPFPPDDIARMLLERMDTLMRTQGLPWRPGAEELLREVHEAGVPQALATMSYGPYVEAAVDGAPDGIFRVVRTGDSVSRGKPAPDIYLAAASDLGLAPAQCLAIEDSESGARAILAAGVTPVVVPGHGVVPELPGAVRWETLAGVTLGTLRETHARWQSGNTA